MINPAKALVAATLLLAAAACGGGSSSSTTGGSTTTGTADTQACNDQATAVCKLRDGCAPGFEIARVFGTQAACVSRTAQTCLNNLGAKGIGTDPTHIEACAAAYPSESCADFFDNNPVSACVPVAGSLSMGAACGTAGQCASTYCAVTSTSVCSTCQPLPAPGAACAVQADCGRDLACAIPSGATAGVCAAFVDMGGACLTGHQPCKASLSCVGDDTTAMTMGTCQPAGGMGASCQTTRKTVPGCSTGFACIAPSGMNGMGTCQAIQLAAAGAMCGNIGTPVTSVVQCENNGLCKKAMSTDPTGTCVAAAGDGMPCDSDPSKGPPCLQPAKCVPPAGSTGTAGTCTVPGAATCM